MGFDHGISRYEGDEDAECLISWRKHYDLSADACEAAEALGLTDWGREKKLDPHYDINEEFVLALLRAWKDDEYTIRGGDPYGEPGIFEVLLAAMRGERLVYWESI